MFTCTAGVQICDELGEGGAMRIPAPSLPSAQRPLCEYQLLEDGNGHEDGDEMSTPPVARNLNAEKKVKEDGEDDGRVLGIFMTGTDGVLRLPTSPASPGRRASAHIVQDDLLFSAPERILSLCSTIPSLEAAHAPGCFQHLARHRRRRRRTPHEHESYRISVMVRVIVRV
ncbi:hypothetical protein MVEN_00318800 [Mycena venus]|uniref:Uncharacterized protein n=1 Tax=Mycena venus TaxID=2733690 RepID=A0A8H6YTF8_9AGAR|nr:hypothetical protein MVEN_00318800 [Mycena venus]